MKKLFIGVANLVLMTITIPALLRADSVLTTIEVGNGTSSGVSGVAANPATNRIYVGVPGTNEVVAINGKIQEIAARIAIGHAPQRLAVNPRTNRVYATSCDFNTASCSIVVIDGRTNSVIATIPIASGSSIGLQGLAVNPVTDRIYASDADNGQYIVIDGKTNTVVTLVPVFTQPAGIAVNPKTNRVYVVGGGFPGEILVFNGDTNALLATIPEDFGVEEITTNFRLNRIYVTQDSGSLVVADGGTNQNTTQIPTGQFPHGVDVNLVNSKVYVANEQSGDVTIIDGNTNQVLQTLPIPAVSPGTVAVNLATGLTYVSDFSSDKVVVLQPN
jgi:YVTN family beta-propeller protein